MLKCASVFTHEIDDPEKALTEIKTQMDKKLTLLDHSAGIVMCHTEFVASGVLKHICQNLPFDLAGTTTSSQAVNDDTGELILTIFVMTSDDVRFRTGITDSLNDGIDEPVKAAYEKAAAAESALPALAIVLSPFSIEKHSGDAHVRAWKKIIPGTPLFGTLAVDDTVSFEKNRVIYRGADTKEAAAFVLCYGNITPRFFIAALPQNDAISLQAVVTKSKGNFVHEINHKSAQTFFADLGTPESMITVPLMVNLLNQEDYDGIPVIRGQAGFTEEGTGIFCGDVDEGSTVSLVKFDFDDILSASQKGIERINTQAEVNGALLFSCISRRMLLLGAGAPLSELKAAKDTINPDIPFMMGYSGGEFCPTSVKNNVPANRFHNFSLIILVV
ncbi:MAG: FIST C-terminal domain-containing protein [Treponema sp.]|nr:FIST C-terminal domain-containing protein [Treponema sp.]